MTTHIIIGNFGNHSLAALAYLHEQMIEDLHFCYVDTGWMSAAWQKRIEAACRYAESIGVKVHCLKPKAQFADLVLARNQFPSRKFQWCTSFLKGLTLLSFLEEFDSTCEALIVFGKRRKDALRFADLNEFEEDSEHFEGRTLWHPLLELDDEGFKMLVSKTGLAFLSHASLECNPCIHFPNQMDDEAKSRVKALEEKIGMPMFVNPIANEKNVTTDLKQFDLGCGAIFGCGE
ncbi:MAG: hypothetical protein LCH30_05790 [Proteobacteria bacterium]|nr:hypothetical protein [Pseudomonadota bacterium]